MADRPTPEIQPQPAHEATGPDYLTLPYTAATFRTRDGGRDELETYSAPVLFARLHVCAVAGAHVEHFTQGGRALTADSLAALNCYLRSARIGRLGLPWHRSTPTRNQYDWRAFVAHLELEFSA